MSLHLDPDLVFPGLVALAAAALTWRGGWLVVMGRRSLGWPTTGGRIRLTADKPWDEDSSPMHGVIYNYDVDGGSYLSSRIAFGLSNETRKHYLDTQWVTVHYDPRKPSRAVLRPGAREAYGHLGAAALLWALAAAWPVLVAALR